MTTTAKPKARKKPYEGPSSEEILIADLITLMESNDLPPWRREWQGRNGEHRNLETGNPYRGSNPILLELGSLMRGHTLPLWIGGAQAKAKGWFPKKGTKAVRIVRPQLNKREEETADGNKELRSWVSYKPCAVFCASDLRGATDEAQASLEACIAAALGQPVEATPRERLDAAEAVLEAWPVATTFGGARACYLPSLDTIGMPDADAFTSREAFAATWAHEQAHSTGHHSRLNRPVANPFGTKAYAREELIAELAAVLICYRLQIGSEMTNHAAYLKDWARLLKEEPKALFKILSQARQAADMIAPEAPVSEEA